MTMKTIFVSFLLLSTTSFSATELARVNQKVITMEEFNRKLEDLIKYSPGAPIDKKQLLEDLIKRELAIQEARKMKLDQDPLVQDRMETVLYQSLLEKKMEKEIEKINVSLQEAKSFYDKNPMIRTSHIFIGVPPGASAEVDAQAKKRIQDIYTQHVSPGKMSFAEIAQKFSEGPTAALGGDVDYQPKERLDPDYYRAALSLRSPGKVSGIVKTAQGYHIIRLTDIRPWSKVDQTLVKRLAAEERKRTIFERYMSELRSKATVSVKSNLLK